MKDKLKEYIKNNLVKEKKHSFRLSTKFKSLFTTEECFEESNNTDLQDKSSYNIQEFVEQKNKYSNFQNLLFKMIDERNLKDSDVYNKVHIDRRLFSKIRNENYHPSKETIILLGLSLELNEEEIIKLLDSASYSLPKNNYYDLIIRFCFINKIYDIFKVNELLDEYNCKLFNV